MNLTGYYYAASHTHVFCDEANQGLCRIVEIPLRPIRIFHGKEMWTANRGRLQIFTSSGSEIARVLPLDSHHFIITTPKEMVAGRVIHGLFRTSIAYSGLDDEEVGKVEYQIDKSKTRGLSHQQNVATICQGIEDEIAAVMLAVPFLGIRGIEVG